MENANFKENTRRLTNTNHPAREDRQGAQGAGRVGGGSARAGKHGASGLGLGGCGGLFAQHFPCDIRAEFFAGDRTSSGAFNPGAMFGGDTASRFPHAGRACSHPNSGGEGGDAARGIEGSFKGGHGANSFAHVCECMALTHVKQPLGVITLVKSFSDRLKEARKELGLSQAALAQKVGVKPGAVGNWESGERGMPRSIIALAKELNVRPEWLKDGKLPREAGAVAACSDVGEALHLLAAQLRAAVDLQPDAVKVLLAMLVDVRHDDGKVHKAVSLIQQLIEADAKSDSADSGNGAGQQTSPLQSRAG